MKPIGLVGGMSWHASAYYYRLLNELSEERYGSQHNARSVMETLSFAPLLSAVQQDNESLVTSRIVEAARRIESGGAGCVLITAFTAHFAAEAVANAVSIPLIHAGDAVAAAGQREGHRRIGLLGTRFTLNAGHIAARIEAAGMAVVLPSAGHKEEIDTMIQQDLTAGQISEREGKTLDAAVRDLADQGADAVALACTELPLLLPRTADLPMIDGVAAHVIHALDFAEAVQAP